MRQRVALVSELDTRGKQWSFSNEHERLKVEVRIVLQSLEETCYTRVDDGHRRALEVG